MATKSQILLQTDFLSELKLYHQILLFVDVILILLLIRYITIKTIKYFKTRHINLIALPAERMPDNISFNLKFKNNSNLDLKNAYIHLLIQEKHHRNLYQPMMDTNIPFIAEELPFQGLLPWTDNPNHKANPFMNIAKHTVRIQDFLIYHPQSNILELKSERGVKNFRVANTQTIFLSANEEFAFTIFINADNIPQKSFKFIWDPLNFKLRPLP